jgi:hypothetical protein
MSKYFSQSPPQIAKTLVLTGCVASALFTTSSAQAAIFNATFNSTVSGFTGSNPLENMSVGNPFQLTIALDNGADSLLSQTWSAANIVSVTYDFNNGAHKTVFNPNGTDGVSYRSVGSFVTNALGQLTAVPREWIDNSSLNVVSTNAFSIPTVWYIDGAHNVYGTNNGSVGINNVSGNIVASNWTISASSAAVPEPLTILGAMTAAGFGVGFKRRLAKSLDKDDTKD